MYKPSRALHLGPPLPQLSSSAMASPASTPPATARSSVFTPPLYAPPSSAPASTTRHPIPPRLASRPGSTYSDETARGDVDSPFQFPPKPAFSREGTSFSAPSLKGGSHSRNHSVEFLVAHDRSNAGTPRPEVDRFHHHQMQPAHEMQSESGLFGSLRPRRAILGGNRSNGTISLVGRAWLGGLIKAPVVRQFLHDGHLYKEEEERGISHFELFADLVFVALIHVSTGCIPDRLCPPS